MPEWFEAFCECYGVPEDEKNSISLSSLELYTEFLEANVEVKPEFNLIIGLAKKAKFTIEISDKDWFIPSIIFALGWYYKQNKI